MSALGILVLSVVAVACLAVVVHRARTDGHLRSRRGERVVLTAAEVGSDLGERGTFLQFSSAFCAPCRATRQVLAGVVAEAPGVAHVDVDAESRLDLVRRLGVHRTPTVLVLDGSGSVLSTVTGVPRRAEALAAAAALSVP